MTSGVKVKYRIRKTIIHNLEKLITKYSLEDVRMIINKYFNDYKDKKRLENEIIFKERQLEVIFLKLDKLLRSI